jgi:hypothetical protein
MTLSSVSSAFASHTGVWLSKLSMFIVSCSDKNRTGDTRHT